jgi:LAO/AO transport system kinase
VGEKKSKKKSEKKTRSALNVMPGVDGRQEENSASKSGKKKRPSRSANQRLTTGKYIKGILKGDRTILGRAITLIESNATTHQTQAQEVLKELIPHTGNSIRIGITGTPGAGKSTFIETFGCFLTDNDHKVAVMAVDPTSSLTKGSILGDKTRMEELSRRPNAFIRPSPSGGTLGGVARKTRETMLIFEAAGYDVIIVETIGVGQSEITVRSMVDFFLLLLIPGAGDELQGIKKGVVELADAIIINKADGDNVRRAQVARDEYSRALHYLSPKTRGWQTEVHTASALKGEGIESIWNVIEKYQEITSANGFFEENRSKQAMQWLHSMLQEKLSGLFFNNKEVKKILPEIEKGVLDGTLPATQAAWKLLSIFEDQLKNE